MLGLHQSFRPKYDDGPVCGKTEWLFEFDRFSVENSIIFSHENNFFGWRFVIVFPVARSVREINMYWNYA